MRRLVCRVRILALSRRAVNRLQKSRVRAWPPSLGYVVDAHHRGTDHRPRLPEPVGVMERWEQEGGAVAGGEDMQAGCSIGFFRGIRPSRLLTVRKSGSSRGNWSRGGRWGTGYGRLRELGM